MAVCERLWAYACSMLAPCGIARTIQAVPKMELAPGETWEEPGAEWQHLTFTLSNADSCKVLIT